MEVGVARLLGACARVEVGLRGLGGEREELLPGEDAMAELRRRNQRVAKEIKPAARTGGQKSARLRMIVQPLTLERPVLPAVPPGPGIGQGRCPRYV